MDFITYISGVASSNTSLLELNAQEIEFLKQIIDAKPTLFNDVFADGIITASDIPNIILILTNFYKERVAVSKEPIDVIKVVEFTVEAFIDTLPIPEIERTVFVGILKVSIQLLRTNLPAIQHQVEVAKTNCSICTYRLFHRTPKPTTPPVTNTPPSA
jgi:hypothetical protein